MVEYAGRAGAAFAGATAGDRRADFRADVSAWLSVGPVPLLADCAWAHGGASGWLSPAERQRFARLAAPRRRAQFLAGHCLARLALAAVGGGDWREWELGDADGRPVVLGGPGAAATDWNVSLSHSGKQVACALARGKIVGVDLEAGDRARQLERLVGFVCSKAERRRLDRLEGAAREQAFRLLWTLKEAWFKQRGEGLAPARLAQLCTEPAAQGAHAWTWRAAGAALAVVAPAPATAPRWIPLGLADIPEPGKRWQACADGWRVLAGF